MLKPNSLREHLIATTPELKTNPDKLVIMIKAGTIAAAFTESLSFEYRYTLNIIVLDYASHADMIMVPMLSWLQVNQVELFDNAEKREKAIRFEAEFLNRTTMDLSIELDLTERVIVELADAQATSTAKRYTITHTGEPPRAS